MPTVGEPVSSVRGEGAGPSCLGVFNLGVYSLGVDSMCAYVMKDLGYHLHGCLKSGCIQFGCRWYGRLEDDGARDQLIMVPEVCVPAIWVHTFCVPAGWALTRWGSSGPTYLG